MMPLYNFVGVKLDGNVERSRIEASDKPAAQKKLAQQGVRLVSIDEAKTQATSLRNPWAKLLRRLDRAPSHQLELLLEQLAVMLETGLPLVQSLEHCERTFTSRHIRRLCRELTSVIEGGESFAKAVEINGAFAPVVRHLIAVGEASGRLPAVLKEAATFMARRRETTSALVGALAYPSVVATAATAVAIYLVGWVIPKLAGMLQSMGRKMPPMTQRLVDLSDFMRAYGTEIAVVFVCMCLSLIWLYVRPQTRPMIDRWLLRIPFIGSALRMSESQFLSNSLSIMLRSGVNLQEAIQTIASAHRNQHLGGIVAASVKRLGQGETLTQALQGFDPLLNSLISIGERTGELVKALEHLAKLYSTQLDISLKRMSRVIEPAIIIIVGGAVGYVYAAFFMALMSTGANFK